MQFSEYFLWQNRGVVWLRLRAAAVLFLCAASSAQAEIAAKVVAGEYIVRRVQTQQLSQGAAYVAPPKSAELVRMPPAGNALPAMSSREAPYNRETAAQDCAKLNAQGDVLHCEPNFVRDISRVPADSSFLKLWGLSNSRTDTDINAAEAWDYTTGSHDTIIAFIDTGINYLHPDLIPNLWVNTLEIPENGIDDDKNGYVDDVHGANTFYDSGDPWDCSGHGSHVAGIAAAGGDNATGVVGVNWHAQILAVSPVECRAVPSLSVYDIVEAIDYVIALKTERNLEIPVVNASFSGGGYSEEEFNAVKRLRSAGIILAAAAGNEGVNIDRYQIYPSNYNLDNIVSVTSVDQNGDLSYFSNRGKKNADIAAPGEFIFSTFRGIASNPEQYEYLDGTSMATPYVSGALALLHSYRPELSAAELLSVMYAQSRPLAGLERFVRTGKLLDVGAMLRNPTGGQTLDPVSGDPLVSQLDEKSFRALISVISGLVRAERLVLELRKPSQSTKLTARTKFAREASQRNSLRRIAGKLTSLEKRHGEILRTVMVQFTRKHVQSLSSHIETAIQRNDTEEWQKVRRDLQRLLGAR